MKQLFFTHYPFLFVSIFSIIGMGCGNSPIFVNPPSPSYVVTAPAEFQGEWVREGYPAQHLRISKQEQGPLRLEFITLQTPKASESVKPTETPAAPKIVAGQTLRFDNTDWILLDWRAVIAAEGLERAGQGVYEVIKYTIITPHRICGTGMSANVFAEAIKSGELKGKVDTSMPLFKIVTVASPSADWVNWWSSLPTERKIFAGPMFCFKREGT